ncbi:MAG: hypothetical protein KDB27_17470 [Planctomycetales bacterium]|nr:hypothetical protein [Planctomycetales bacterium]
MPQFAAEANAIRYQDNVEFLGICLDNDRKAISKIMKKNKVDWPQIVSEGSSGWKSSLAKQLKISSVPMTFLIGPDGRVVATDISLQSVHQIVSDWN